MDFCYREYELMNTTQAEGALTSDLCVLASNILFPNVLC